MRRLGGIRAITFGCGCRLYPQAAGRGEDQDLTIYIKPCGWHTGVDSADISDFPSESEMMALVFTAHRRWLDQRPSPVLGE